MVSTMRGSESLLDRRDAVTTLLANRGDSLVVSGLGSPSYDVHACGDSHANYYLWGAMGSASLVGLGLARARPDRRVIVITGDGEQLMGLGGLATIGVCRPANLTILVIDNGHFGETGMQASHTGKGVNLAAIAADCGFAHTATIQDESQLDALGKALHQSVDGPRLIVVKVEARNHPRSLPPRDGVAVKNRFRAHLQLSVR
jgi:thiamine pyrophosphate-dependent acetolactate synthase large subunit-like protein